MVNNKATCKNTNSTSGDSDIPRRRGRPAGKNRVPLSQEERRARNAQYERERRIETAEAMSDLIDAAHCDPDISNAELLATVISRIQRASRNFDDINDLKRINENLEAQIATLQDRLGLDDEDLDLLDADDDYAVTAEPQSSSTTRRNAESCMSESNILKKQRKKRKHLGQLSSNQPEKRSKTRSETSSVDSGIELRGHTVSPFNSQWIPSMESQTSSLMEVPPITPPQQAAPDCLEVPHSDLADPENVELPRDFQEPLTLDILTDSEKMLLSELFENYPSDESSY